MTLYQYNGSGSVTPQEKASFSTSEFDVRRTYDYNLDSSFENLSEDYQLITNNFTSSNEYGQVTQLSGQTIDYLFITQTPINTTQIPFGGITLSGSAITQPNIRLYFSGEAVEKVIYSPDNTTGTLFSFGQKVERVTFDYNESSVENTEEDFGFVNQITSQEDDYLLITSSSTLTEEYGLITEQTGGSISPFGGLTFSGSAITQPNYRLYFSGEAVEKVIYSPDNTTGTLFSFGQKLESFTFDYNETSFYSNDDDYQLISLSPSDAQDYGLISESGGTQTPENYGLITETVTGGSLITPFGSLFFTGSAITAVESTYTYTGSGLITLSGTAVEKFTADTPDNTQLFQISGSSLDSSISDYVGTGTLFGFGEKIERRTYNYDETDVVEFNTFDYQFITLSPNEINDDYGDLTPASESDDYGIIVGFGATETLYPFGSLFISGTATEKETEIFKGSGTILISGDSTNQRIGSETAVGVIVVSGTAIEKEVDSYVGLGTLTLSNFALESEIETYTGSGLITLFGTALESLSAQTPENTQLFQISGTAVEKDVDSYVGLGTILISDSLVEKEVDSYVGLGTIFISGTVLESFTESPYTGSGLITLSGTAVEKFTGDTPDNTQLFEISGVAVEKDVDSYVGVGTLTLSGELIHPNIDYTPHYGIEKNIGIGTTGIQISGAVDDSKQRTARGTGTIFINGLGTESRTIYIPISGIGTGFIGGSISISSGIAQTHYYSPIYPRNAGIVGSGIGTIRINDDSGRTITRAVLPYFGRGTIILSGIGAESFTQTNYDGSGLITLSGISSDREIAVYTKVGSGLITITPQTLIEKEVDAYDGSGSIAIFGASVNKQTYGYDGTGTITLLSGAAESLSAQTPENTQLFIISGSASEAYSAQTPEIEVLYQFNGNLVESRTYGYAGSGQGTFSSSANTSYKPSVSGTGLFRFATRLSDNLYDTCDSIDVTCDYIDSAFVSFVSNPPENTVLYNFNGSATTKEIQVYKYIGFGSVGISGSHIIRKTKSVVGIGTLSITSTSVEKDVDSYVGSGSIAVLSGSAQAKVSVIPQSTIIFSISGISSTRTLKVKTYSGVGTAYFNGSASTKVLSRPSYSGVGTIYLSGQLVYPDIKYVPAPKGSGVISVVGSANEKIRYDYLPVIQPLFVFSGGFESFSETGYIGIGTIYIQSTSASTVNNPFQIPRLYVTII